MRSAHSWRMILCLWLPLSPAICWTAPSLIYMDNKTWIRITNTTGLIWCMCTNKVLQIAGEVLRGCVLLGVKATQRTVELQQQHHGRVARSEMLAVNVSANHQNSKCCTHHNDMWTVCVISGSHSMFMAWLGGVTALQEGCEANDHSSRLRFNFCECDRRGSFLEGHIFVT